MSFLNKESIKTERRIKRLKSSGIYDVINVILGLIIIVIAVVIFIDKEKYSNLFAIEFLFAAGMNICMSLKYYQRQEVIKVIVGVLAVIFFIIMAVLGFLAL